MILFIVLAASLTALALAWLLWPLLRTRASREMDRERANLGVLRDQLSELDAEHARGALADDVHAQMKADLERRVLDESLATAAPPGQRSSAGSRAAAVLALALPLAAALAYWQFGDPQAFDPALASATEANPHALQPDQIARMVAALEERLQREPDNLNGWVTLARTYSTQQRFTDAVRAYEKLLAAVPDDADLLADYADALAMAEGRRIGAGPMAAIKKALAINPTQWKALAMAGTEAFDRKDYKAALGFWERLQRSLPPDAPMAQSIGASIAEARQLAGMSPAAPKAPAPAPAQAQAAAPAVTTRPGTADARVGGTVDLSPALKARAAPQDRVFVFARAVDGPRLPLALLTVQVKDLPLKFALDDSMAMSPDAKLSAFPNVIVGARISKSGNAPAASGDLEGLSPPVKLGATNVAITIDRVLP